LNKIAFHPWRELFNSPKYKGIIPENEFSSNAILHFEWRMRIIIPS